MIQDPLDVVPDKVIQFKLLRYTTDECISSPQHDFKFNRSQKCRRVLLVNAKVTTNTINERQVNLYTSIY